ncbi:MAG: VWA domain-containing protein [Lachnospiraceae bacterium]|nr:VWA domain-containing protein [Lachnospiraceae bacterium]
MRKDERELNGKKVLSAMEHIDPDLITEAEPGKVPASRIVKLSSNKSWLYAGICAACALVVGGITLGVALSNRPGTEPGSYLASQESESTKQGTESSEGLLALETGHEKTDPSESSPFESEPVTTEIPETEPPVSELEATTDPKISESKDDESRPVPYSPDWDIAAEEGLKYDKPGAGEINAIEPGASDALIHDTISGHDTEVEGEPYPIDIEPIVEPGSSGGETEAPEDPSDKFGILTAGRWNDNNNWGFFKNLVTTEAIHFPAYGLNPVFRSAVTVKDESGSSVKGIKVEAVYSDDDSLIWSAVTNKEGEAYLFLPESENRSWKIKAYDTEGNAVYAGTDVYDLPGKPEDGTPDSQSRTRKQPEELELTVETASRSYKKTQVMFILDTTGSMGDELTYLQADFGKIMERVEADGVSYSWNFYRDEGDDYVTRINGFDTDVNNLKKILNNESADGGGDTPEAVAQILTETMSNAEWDADSVKIAFLIFDAPPHEGTENQITAAVAKAAEQGIHLIPVVSSNSERETELFGRALAIMTDGEYVFLTDDSGVGDSHLEPIIGDYEVQKLGDIIVDIINEYAVIPE